MSKTTLPGFVDLHVHLREPGFSYKESIKTGTSAARKGGYAAVCCMPNVDPPPDSLAHLQVLQTLLARDAAVRVCPVGAISKGQKGEGVLSAMEEMAPHVCGFSDDGLGVQDGHLMRAAMETAKALRKPIMAHCEDLSLRNGGYVHDGTYCARHALKGISSASEWVPLARDLELARQTGAMLHVCHVSTRESVELLRAAKHQGVHVTAETAPHYLLLCDEDLQDDGRFKMNPPLRGAQDRDALLAGLQDGTLDCIATDHAPHSADEKKLGLLGSLFGIVGLETAFSALYTRLVRTERLEMPLLLQAMAHTPRRLLETWASVEVDQPYDWDLDEKWLVDPANFSSRGRATPFAGWDLFGVCLGPTAA